MLEVFSKLFPKIKKQKTYKPIITTSESGVNGTYTCKVIMLDGTTTYLDVKPNEKGQVILNQVCAKLRLYEKEFFSIKYLENGFQKWLKLSKALNNQISGPPPHTLIFCVRFYPMGPARILSEIGRYQVYLQVRKDIQQGRLPLTEELSPTFAALSLHADVGDVDLMSLDPEDLLIISVFKPQKQTLDEFKASVLQEQKKLEGKSSGRAEFLFLEQSSWLDHYGVEIHDVRGTDGSLLQLGISPTGLLLFRDGQRVGAHYWPRLSKISFKNKTLQLKVIVTTGGEETRSYESNDKDTCKMLYKSCIAHHAFFKLSSIHQSQPQNSLKHSNSSSRIFTIGSKTSKRDQPTIIPDVVSGQAFDQSPFEDHHHHRSHRRSRRSSGSESCPETERYASRPSSCAMMPIGRRNNYIATSPMDNERSFYYGEASSRRMSPISMHAGYHQRHGWHDVDYISGSESESQDRRFHRGHPIYMTTVDTRRSRPRPSDDASFYSEVECDPPHRRHCRSRPRVYPDDPYASRRGFVDRYRGDRYHGASRHGGNYHHVYDHLPTDGINGDMYPHERETTIRWADEREPGDYERGRQSRSQGQSEVRKRHRKRSQSPGCGSKPPQELANHFRYVDQSESGFTDDQLRDIPYTRVETDIASVPTRYSPRTRNKIRMSRRSQRRQNSDISGMCYPDGEAPPPYLGDAHSPVGRAPAPTCSRSRRILNNNEGQDHHDEDASLRQRNQVVSRPDAYLDTIENYRREVSLSLSRRELDATLHDGSNPQEGSSSSSRPYAYVDTVENYRREMRMRYERSMDHDESSGAWQGPPEWKPEERQSSIDVL